MWSQDQAGDAQPDAGTPATDGAGYGLWGDPLSHLPRGEAQRTNLCSSGHDDLVHDMFCGDEPVRVASLHDLQLAFKLEPEQLRGIAGVAATGHSTALSMRSVSAINPRVILFRVAVELQNETQLPGDYVSLGFARGEQFVEIVVMGRKSRQFNFDLLRFEQDCNASAQGCLPGDLLTPDLETHWRDVTIYDEAALANTVLDCAPCHQPGGPASKKILRMQEFEDPWTHWFFSATDGGRALMEDYRAARGDERIAGLSVEQLSISPGGMAQFIGSRDHDQPNKFRSHTIEREVAQSAAMAGGRQPFDNSVPGSSATWRESYERAMRGEAIAFPYSNVKVTEATKLERMTRAYQAYRRGDLDRSELPDLRDVYPDDPAKLAAMGMATEPGLSGEAVLIQSCSQCHNERLDQSLSRARFRADLAGVTRAERDLAIERLQLPETDIRAMPPPRLRLLTDEARARAIEALRH